MSPKRTVRQRKVGPRRENILNSARELFFLHGYRGTTIQEISERAGYSKRTVYLDYMNKDELFMTLCAEGGQLLLEALTESQVVAPQLSPEAGISQTISALIDFSRDHREYFNMIFNESSPEIVMNCSEELRQRIADLERACMKVLVSYAERAVQEGLIRPIDPWEAAAILSGATSGIIQLSFSGSQTIFSQETLERLVRKSVGVIWQGLASPL